MTARGYVAGGQRALLALVFSGIALYIVLDVVAQALPPHYSPISQAESLLAVGPYGYVMTVNFVVRGALSLLLVAAYARAIPRASQSRAGLILLGVWGIGALLLAAFPTDAPNARPTVHGAVHLIVALAAFVCGPLGALLLARARRKDASTPIPRALLVGVAVAALVAAGLVILGAPVATRAGIWGLLERILIGLVLLWMLLAALDLWVSQSLIRQLHSQAPAIRGGAVRGLSETAPPNS